MFRIDSPTLKWLCVIALAINCCLFDLSAAENVLDDYEGNSAVYSIEGKVYAPELFSSSEFNWQQDTTITINDGEYSGFLRDDGSFIISGVPSGSYVVEIFNPDYYYEAVSNVYERHATHVVRVQFN